MNRLNKDHELSWFSIKSETDYELINKIIVMDAMPIIGLPLLEVINTSLP